MAEDMYDSDGTELFLSLDGTTVINFDCPTALTGLGFTAAEREQSCLNNPISTSKPGKRKLNAFQVPFRVTRGSDAHQYLLGLSEEANPNLELPYAVGWTDGTADPDLDTSGAFVAPGTGPAWTRTTTVGSLYVSAVSFDFNDGQDVMGSFTAMPQSQKTYWKPVA